MANVNWKHQLGVRHHSGLRTNKVQFLLLIRPFKPEMNMVIWFKWVHMFTSMGPNVHENRFETYKEFLKLMRPPRHPLVLQILKRSSQKLRQFSQVPQLACSNSETRTSPSSFLPTADMPPSERSSSMCCTQVSSSRGHSDGPAGHKALPGLLT